MKIAVAGTGYVGLSISVLLSQYHEVIARDIIAEKVEMIHHSEAKSYSTTHELLLEVLEGLEIPK